MFVFVQEGELDYEEDEGETLDTNKQETPKKTKETSDIEEGELEDGEVNSDGEEGEILSDKDEVSTMNNILNAITLSVISINLYTDRLLNVISIFYLLLSYSTLDKCFFMRNAIIFALNKSRNQ